MIMCEVIKFHDAPAISHVNMATLHSPFLVVNSTGLDACLFLTINVDYKRAANTSELRTSLTFYAFLVIYLNNVIRHNNIVNIYN